MQPKTNFEKWEDFFPDSPLQLADATLFKFNYIPWRARAFPLPRGLVTAPQREFGGGRSSRGEEKNGITACLLLLRDARGNCYIWLRFLAKFFNCFVIRREKKR